MSNEKEEMDAVSISIKRLRDNNESLSKENNRLKMALEKAKDQRDFSNEFRPSYVDRKALRDKSEAEIDAILNPQAKDAE